MHILTCSRRYIVSVWRKYGGKARQTLASIDGYKSPDLFPMVTKAKQIEQPGIEGEIAGRLHVRPHSSPDGGDDGSKLRVPSLT